MRYLLADRCVEKCPEPQYVKSEEGTNCERCDADCTECIETKF